MSVEIQSYIFNNSNTMYCITYDQISPNPHPLWHLEMSLNVQAKSMQQSFTPMIITELVRMAFSYSNRMHHVSREQWPWGHLYIPIGLYACGRSKMLLYLCCARVSEKESESHFTCWSKACACALVIAFVVCTVCLWKSSPFVWAPGKRESGSCWIDQSHKIPFQLAWLVHSLSI